MAYPIFPSLTRTPSYKSTRSLEDGTIKDKMESGYVATRPRFTRQRRTFGVTYDYLTAEDLRALDLFEVATVQGQAGAFYLPNLLPNGSFENVPDTGYGVDGWTAVPTEAWSIAQSANAADGLVAMAFTSSAPATAAAQTAQLVAAGLVPVNSGDVYQVAASVSLASEYADAVVSLAFVATVLFADESEQTIAVPLVSVPTVGYASFAASFTVPFETSGGPGAVNTTPPSAVSMQAAFQASLVQGGGSTGTANSATILLDSVGLALTSSTQPYGRIVGSLPTASAVRFTKQPAVNDAGWASGGVRYSCMFEVTEV